MSPIYWTSTELQRDVAAEIGVLSLVHHSHASAAQLFDDAVVRDGLADHLWRILRGRNGQVNESRGVGAIKKGCC